MNNPDAPTRIVMTRGGAEIDGKQRKQGEILTVPRFQAEALARNGAANISQNNPSPGA